MTSIIANPSELEFTASVTDLAAQIGADPVGGLSESLRREAA